MRKENIKLTIIISLLVVFSLSTTYAYLELGTGGGGATGEGGCFEVDYSGTTINAGNIQSVPDEEYEQGSNSTITLSKDEGCKIYTEATIHLHTNTSQTTAPLCYDESSANYLETSCAMKYKVMNGTQEISSGVLMAETTDQVLATVELTDNPTAYNVYIWIDLNTSAGTYNDTTYSGYIYANSTQSSTVTQ